METLSQPPILFNQSFCYMMFGLGLRYLETSFTSKNNPQDTGSWWIRSDSRVLELWYGSYIGGWLAPRTSWAYSIKSTGVIETNSPVPWTHQRRSTVSRVSATLSFSLLLTVVSTIESVQYEDPGHLQTLKPSPCPSEMSISHIYPKEILYIHTNLCFLFQSIILNSDCDKSCSCFLTSSPAN